MKHILLLVLLVFSVLTVMSQENIQWKGNWKGHIIDGKKNILFFMIISKNDSAGYILKMEVPEQGVKDIKPIDVSIENDSIKFTVKGFRAKYRGVLKDNKQIEGLWTQGGKDFVLNFDKTEKELKLNRPQNPQGPFPYTEERVTFTNIKDKTKLGGTITIPKGTGPFPAVILVSGSGQQDRDCEILGHKSFLVLADYLSRNGVVVLRYDDRGVGESEGNPVTATTKDFAIDATSALLLLRKHPSVDKKRLGIIGHSEGGIIAPMIASKTKEVAFVVLLAAPAIDIMDLMVIQNRKMVEQDSLLTKEQMPAFENTVRNVFKAVVGIKDQTQSSKKVLEIYKAYTAGLDSTVAEKLGFSDRNLRLQLFTLMSPWYRYFLSIKPQMYLQKVHCPVLAFNGSNDTQVTPDENLGAIGDALTKAGNKNYKLNKVPELNHLFQHSVTGLPDEYATIEETFSTEVMETIGKWILERK